eukprot:CAMPEP_0117454782 /NCGR_PEP_ID=MMETSP0759-20121206/10993_1 /TAXON_ID=63605 /ORGANISM="Percolomonas cosmopolitus, Strain WS" /LENGTH=287 /DNA_ID=CAMNT_0005248009 /DNA_START=41 /DNA_END=904 /DNA_ORIENTATION=+
MKYSLEEYLTYDDVCLVPQYNNVPSRLEPSTETWLTKNTKIGCPLLASNMDTVICPELADVILANGSMPIFHRFASFEAQKEWVDKYKENCFISCGVNEEKYEDAVKLLERGARGCVIDIAHGHSDTVCRLVSKLRKQLPEKDVIAGNVCTVNGYQDLVSSGATGVKIGVGCGAACTTRIKTGFGLPQFSTILNCAEYAKKLRVPIIADGGINFEKDMVLALAAGASTVMCGKLFSKTRESACQKQYVVDPVTREGKWMGRYRGQASAEFQMDFYGGMKKGKEQHLI